MPLKFNPFTAQFDLTGSGGGGASYIDGEVATYNDLPLDGTAALNSAWLVRTASGVWPVSRKQAGIYIRTATAGSSRDTDYTYAGTMPDVFSDSVFLLYDEASTTRTGQFNLGSITAGQNRVLTWPDGNGTIARTEDFAAPPAIGSTTRNTGAFTTLSANNGTITASAPVLDLSQTWNNAAAEFHLCTLGIGNSTPWTASTAASTLFRIRLASSTVFSVGYTGICNAAGLNIANGTANINGNIQLSSNVTFNAGATTGLCDITSSVGTGLRLYNTGNAIAANYERAKIAWSSNVLQIGTEAGGTGSARNLELQTGGATRVSIAASGDTQLNGFVQFNNNVNIVGGRVLAAQQINLNNSSTALLALGTDSTIRWGASSATAPLLKRSSTALQVRLADDSAFAPLSCGALTLNGNLDASTRDIVTDTTTGTKIGTGTTQKIGFFNATPVTQRAAIADATDAATTQARLNDLLAAMRSLGLIAT